MEVVATAKWVRATPRKARLVAATVEGLSVGDALTILAFTPRAAAIEVAKVVKSAAANAEHNYNLDVSTLRVARIEIDGATVIKRFQPRAQGRAFSILKRTTTSAPWSPTTQFSRSSGSGGASRQRRRQKSKWVRRSIPSASGSGSSGTGSQLVRGQGLHEAPPRRPGDAPADHRPPAQRGLARIETERSANQMTSPSNRQAGHRHRQAAARRSTSCATSWRSSPRQPHPDLDPGDQAAGAGRQAGRRERRLPDRAPHSLPPGDEAVDLRTMRAGAKGVRITVGGTPGRLEMPGVDWDRAGRVPLHTLRADIDFGRWPRPDHVRAHRHQVPGSTRSCWSRRGGVERSRRPPPPPPSRRRRLPRSAAPSPSPRRWR